MPLDTSGFNVQREKTSTTVKGKAIESTVLIITDANGHSVSEHELRLASAANLFHLPEVQRRIRELRAEYAARINVTAHTIAAKLETISAHAIRDKQYQVAANCAAMEAKMFGVDAGSAGGGGGDPAPTVAVEVRIRDFTGKPAPRED